MGGGRDYFVVLKMGHHIQQLRTIVSPMKMGVFCHNCFSVLLCPLHAQSQGTVSYSIEFRYKDVFPESFTGELYFDAHQSVFRFDRNTKILPKSDALETAGSAPIKMEKGRTTDSLGRIVFTDFIGKTQVTRDFIRKKPFIVPDTLVAATWELKNEQKKIGSFNCQKAVTRLYGREYEVWYTPEVPVVFGPWKLNGLPGLILEVRSADGEIKFMALQVSLTLKDHYIVKAPTGGEVIKGGYLAFRKLQDQKAEEIGKYVKSLANEVQKPGAPVSVGKTTVQRIEKAID